MKYYFLNSTFVLSLSAQPNHGPMHYTKSCSLQFSHSLISTGSVYDIPCQATSYMLNQFRLFPRS